MRVLLILLVVGVLFSCKDNSTVSVEMTTTTTNDNTTSNPTGSDSDNSSDSSSSTVNSIQITPFSNANNIDFTALDNISNNEILVTFDNYTNGNNYTLSLFDSIKTLDSRIFLGEGFFIMEIDKNGQVLQYIREENNVWIIDNNTSSIFSFENEGAQIKITKFDLQFNQVNQTNFNYYSGGTSEVVYSGILLDNGTILIGGRHTQSFIAGYDNNLNRIL